MQNPLTPQMLTPREAAALLNLRVRTLDNWRCRKGDDPGLPYVKIGRAVRYRRTDVMAFLERNTVGGAQ